jgi:hypothetical protein
MLKSENTKDLGMTTQRKTKKPLTRSGQPIDMKLVRESAEKRALGLLGIGRFLVEFSQLEFTIRAALAGRLQLADGLFDIVTSPYDFSALCNVWCKLNILQYPERKKEFEKLFSGLQKLNRQRVVVAHGMWTDEMDGLAARHVSRQTLEAEFHSFKNAELDGFADEAQRLMKAVIGFNGS